MDEPDLVYQRDPQHAGNRKNLDRLEFGCARQRLYKAAGQQVYLTGLGPNIAAEAVAGRVRTLSISPVTCL